MKESTERRKGEVTLEERMAGDTHPPQGGVKKEAILLEADPHHLISHQVVDSLHTLAKCMLINHPLPVLHFFHLAKIEMRFQGYLL